MVNSLHFFQGAKSHGGQVKGDGFNLLEAHSILVLSAVFYEHHVSRPVVRIGIVLQFTASPYLA